MKEEFVTSVFTRCRERLRLTARRLLGNDDDADDALQETFCRLWGKREALRDEAAVEGTTVTTLRNICIDSLRRSAAHPADSVDDQLAAIEARAGLEADQEETELRYAEIAELIDRRLSPRDSQFIYLRDRDGWDFDEIAERFDLDEGNVRVIVSRARRAIRDCYLQRRRQQGATLQKQKRNK